MGRWGEAHAGDTRALRTYRRAFFGYGNAVSCASPTNRCATLPHSGYGSAHDRNTGPRAGYRDAIACTSSAHARDTGPRAR